MTLHHVRYADHKAFLTQLVIGGSCFIVIVNISMENFSYVNSLYSRTRHPLYTMILHTQCNYFMTWRTKAYAIDNQHYMNQTNELKGAKWKDERNRQLQAVVLVMNRLISVVADKSINGWNMSNNSYTTVVLVSSWEEAAADSASISEHLEESCTSILQC